MHLAMPAPGPPIARHDIALAVVFSALAVGFLSFLPDDSGDTGGIVAGLLFLVATVPLAWRRRATLPAVLVTSAGLAIHVAAFGSMTRCGVALPLVFLQAYAAGAWLPRVPAVAVLAALLAAGTLMLGFDPVATIGAVDILFPIGIVVWAIGRVVRSRTALAGRLEDQTGELRAARDERARLEVATDRLKLSTELDELLRRRLADLARQADAGAGAGAGADAGAALVAIEQESRATLDEMRAVVGVLRGDGGDEPTAPQPTLTGLDALLVHTKGADARLRFAGSPRALPAGLELSAFRVVEHLLGALDDAPGVEVAVDFGDDALEIVVAGPARRRADAAVERARERVALHQGTLEATVREGRTRVVAAFPVMAAV